MISLLIDAVRIFTQFLWMVIFARVIMSWLPGSRGSTMGRLLITLTEPILGPIRRLLQKTPLGGPGMMIDLAPMAAFLLIWMGEALIVSFLISMR